jgi:hypothetical protein
MLTDCGQLIMVRLYDAEPVAYVVSSGQSFSMSGWQFDETDELEASICEVLRSRDEIGLRPVGGFPQDSYCLERARLRRSPPWP